MYRLVVLIALFSSIYELLLCLYAVLYNLCCVICFIRFEKHVEVWFVLFTVGTATVDVVGDPQTQVEGVQHPTILVYLVTCNWSLSSLKPLQHCCDHSPETYFSPQNVPRLFGAAGGELPHTPSWLQGVGPPEKGKGVEGKREGKWVKRERGAGRRENGHSQFLRQAAPLLFTQVSSFTTLRSLPIYTP